MAFLGFISAGVGAFLLLVGVLGLLSARVRAILRSIPVANKILDPMTWSVIFIAVGLMAGGFGVVTSYVGLDTASTASVLSPGDEGATTVGGLDLKIHDGVSNATTDEDYYNDEETVLTIYSADANIADGEEYSWNITIEREFASSAGVVTVSCNIPDKEISGITADNLAEKTGGQVDLTIDSEGKHSDDNTVYKRIAFDEGTVSQDVSVAFEQEETYHDGMQDLDDYVTATCTVSDETGSISQSVKTVVYANS